MAIATIPNTLKKTHFTVDELVAALEKIGNDCAMDSARTTDINGYVTIKNVIITSADVQPYIGKSIPTWNLLGLDPDKIYQVYRPLDEITKAKDTFNNMPLLDGHVAIDSTSENVPKIGTIGSVATVVGNDLINDITFWHQSDINKLDGVDVNGNPVYKPKKGISAGYRYTPVLETGVFNGKVYDVRMKDLIANHVAHVETPRNPPSIVPDGFNSQEEDTNMAKDNKDIDMTKDGLAASIMEILEEGGELKEKAAKLAALLKPAADEDDDNKTADDEDDDTTANDNEPQDNPRETNPKTGDSDDKDKYEYVAKDSIDSIIALHNRNYREALEHCRTHLNGMALDSADEMYNTVIKNQGCNPKEFTTLGAKREFVKALNKMSQRSYQPVPQRGMAMDSGSNKAQELARAKLNEMFKKG